MIVDTQDAADQTLGSMVGGIVGDARQLVKQHVALFRQEVTEDFRKAKLAGVAMAAAHTLALVGCVFVVAMLVGLMTWAVPVIPWWGWSGIAGGAMLVLSATVFAVAKRRIASMNLMPDQSVRAIQEDIQWLKQQPTQ